MAGVVLGIVVALVGISFALTRIANILEDLVTELRILRREKGDSRCSKDF